MAFSTFTTLTTIASGVMNANFTDAQNQLNEKLNPKMLDNISLTSSVAANALTIAVKDRNGSDPSSTSPVKVGMRSSTLTSGTWNTRSLTSALSLVVSSGSTLGQTSNQPWVQWIYLLDNAGTLELAISGSRQNENNLFSTTAEGGAGAADSVTTVYSTTARTSVPARLIGKLTNTQTTAGTWASAGTKLEVGNYASLTITGGGVTVQRFTSSTGTYVVPAGVARIKVTLVGGGGGGAGSTTGAASSGGAGGTTSLSIPSSTAVLSATGGQGGAANGGTGDGGSPTINSPAITVKSIIGTAASSSIISLTAASACASPGACSPLGGGGYGAGGTNTGAGGAAKANTGSGGGGGCTVNVAYYSGQGGGAGAYIEAIINQPLSSYDYAVGAAGTAGTGVGGSKVDGGAGAAGIIIVEEFYQ